MTSHTCKHTACTGNDEARAPGACVHTPHARLAGMRATCGQLTSSPETTLLHPAGRTSYQCCCKGCQVTGWLAGPAAVPMYHPSALPETSHKQASSSTYTSKILDAPNASQLPQHCTTALHMCSIVRAQVTATLEGLHGDGCSNAPQLTAACPSHCSVNHCCGCKLCLLFSSSSWQLDVLYSRCHPIDTAAGALGYPGMRNPTK
ncbi:hypothetical protein COO60DRAFT_1491190 [Scenedesmus sp. NREL 46B-D3]|nr:hypothetical protein COO60DRAFT_1491190 [Scenedesmus sp. NREL 46B-D3]